MGLLSLGYYIPVLPIHRIAIERLENWKKEVRVLAQMCLDSIQRRAGTLALSVHEDLYLDRLSILLSEWLGEKKVLNPIDKDLLSSYSRNHLLVSMGNIEPGFEKTHFLDSYLMFTHLFRELSKLTIRDELNADEAAGFIASRTYSPLEIDLTGSSAYVYGQRIYAECFTKSFSGSSGIAAARRLYDAGYKASQVMAPLHTLALLNSVGCLLLCRYRLSRILVHPNCLEIDTYLIGLLTHLTLGVPYDSRKTHTCPSGNACS